MTTLMSVVVLGFVAAVMLRPAMGQTVHVVGDAMGWTIPNGGAAGYTTWAASQRFMVGDILLFNFVTNEHDVVRVTKESFDACTSANTIGDAITAGPANVTLTSSGDHYFICTYGRHCQAGQKLSITVGSAPSAGSPQPSPQIPAAETPKTTAMPSPAGSPQPLPRIPVAGSPKTTAMPSPADCAPTPSPAVGGPAGMTDPTVARPGNSSSSMVVASFAFTMASVVLSLVF